MAGYIGTQAVSVNTTSATISDDLSVGDDLTVTDDATIGGTLGVAGVLTANAGVVVDNFTLDGTTLALSSGSFTLDVAGNIELNTDSGLVALKDASVHFGSLFNSSSDFFIASTTQDKDIKFQGMDGNTTLFTMLQLDASDAGSARFRNGTAALPSISNLADTNTGIFFPTGDTLGFATAATERLRITSAGNVEVKTGNLVIGTSGKGIDFTAADSGAAGSQANLLDDYEEGTCTLTWTGTGGTANSTNANFKYVKVGNLVSINGGTGAALPNATGTLTLTGLPFAANGDSSGSILYRRLTAPSGAHTLIANVFSTQTKIQPFWAAAGDYIALVSGHINTNGAQDMYISCNYRST